MSKCFVSCCVPMVVIAVATAVCVYAQPDNDTPGPKYKGIQRAIRYYPDGTIRSLTVTYPDGETVKKMYDISGQLEQIVHADGTVIDYTFRIEDGRRIAVEKHPDKEIIREFDTKGNIVLSRYPDTVARYSYTMDKYGDIETVTIEYDNDTVLTLTPDDNRLSFLWDYDIIGSDDISQYNDMKNREYLFNPQRFKERMQMQRQYRQ